MSGNVGDLPKLTSDTRRMAVQAGPSVYCADGEPEVYSGQAMAEGSRPIYEVADYEVLAETPELRMVVLTLAEGQQVPWHWHTNVTDRFFCMQGPMVVETRAPREVFELNAGDTCMVPSKGTPIGVLECTSIRLKSKPE